MKNKKQRLLLRKCEYQVKEELNNYKTLQKEGKLVIFPCEINSTIWFLCEDPDENTWYIDKGRVFALGVDENSTIWISAKYESGLRFYHTSKDVGKDIFFSAEEANIALEQQTNEEEKHGRNN